MTSADRHFSPSEAADLLGVSVKALRLYEEKGFLTPSRSATGWRAYGPEQISRAREIVALRALGLSLAQIGRVLARDEVEMARVLAGHQANLETRIAALMSALSQVGALRSELGAGRIPALSDLADLAPSNLPEPVAFELPWPWGGERFELKRLAKLTFIVGPLFSGKTRLARRLAEALPDAGFLELERVTDTAAAKARLADDPALAARVAESLRWIVEDGGTESDAVLALLVALEAAAPKILVIDMIEDGLDQPSQEALMAHLRRRGAEAKPVLCLTRSNAILDLAAVTPDEAILFCPANHSPPMLVAPFPGAPGYEALASCLAAPDVRARTAGVVAYRPDQASQSA